MDPAFACTLPPPYYAVIFTSRRRDNDHEGYAQAARDMGQQRQQQQAGHSGFLGR